MSGLYRTFKSNYIPYFADGRGRDRYIVYNNAGFFKNYLDTPYNKDFSRTGCFFNTKIVKHIKSPSIKAPNFHYHADGSGRDKYIVENGGGLFTDIKPLISYKLTDFLRQREQRILPIKKYREHLSKDEIRYNELLKKKERDVIKRLYTNNKKKCINRPKINFKSYFSVDDLTKDTKNSFIKNAPVPVFLPKYEKNNNNNKKENERDNILNEYSKYYNNNTLRTPKIKLKFNQNQFNFSNEKIIKLKPKIIINDSISNNKGEISKVNFSQENNENSNNKNNINFSTDYKILNDFQMNKKQNNMRKIKKFIISKSNTGDS